MVKIQGKNIKWGFFLLFIWCVISAFSRVYTGDAEQHLNPVALCFYISFFSVIVFVLLTFKKLNSIITKTTKCSKEVIGINLATVGCWFFLFFPLKFLEPSIVAALTLGVTPLATLIISKFIYRQQNIHRYDYLGAILSSIVVCYLIAIGFLGDTAVKHIPVAANILSIICCIIVSTSLAISNIYAKKLSNAGFSPLETLTVRFILLVFISGILTFFIKDGRTLDTPSMTIIAISIAALTVIIIPQFVYQTAIRELQPISVSMILPLMPVMAFFIEFYDTRLNPGIYTIMGILIILGITISSAILRYQQEKKYSYQVIKI